MLNNLGVVAYSEGDVARSVSHYEEALALQRNALYLSNLGEALRDLGDPARATALFKESLILRREHGDRVGIAECLAGLASIAAADRRPAEAARYYGAAEALREAIGVPLRRPSAWLMTRPSQQFGLPWTNTSSRLLGRQDVCSRRNRLSTRRFPWSRTRDSERSTPFALKPRGKHRISEARPATNNAQRRRSPPGSAGWGPNTPRRCYG
jgi:tetratricopeptide (TPR) repeat protein